MSSNSSTGEEWRPILGYEEYYSVSDFGRVRSEERAVWRRTPGREHWLTVPERILKATANQGGRMLVGLYRDGEVTCVQVHRLVLQAFVGPCPEGMEGCHNDGDPLNNHLPNLRWDTHASNQQDMVKHGTRLRGERHPNHKLNRDQVRAIRADARTPTSIAADYGVNPATVRDIKARRSWAWLT